MNVRLMRGVLVWVLLLSAGAVHAQIQTVPLQDAPASADREAEPPPVLSQHPARPALEAVATGGSGGMSYSGPGGAMNTSPNGSTCIVTCATQPQLEQHRVDCPPGNTAFCQCDAQPYASCRAQ